MILVMADFRWLLRAGTVCATCAAILGAFPAAAQNIAGDWQGTLNTGGSGLRVLFHFTQPAGGTLGGNFDSLDQDARGIPISSMALQNGKLTFASKAVEGTFEGRVSADGSTIEGTWNQGRDLPLMLRRPSKSVVAGDWNGAIDAGGLKLRLVFHITAYEGGVLEASFDSLDQGANGILFHSVTVSGSVVKMEAPLIKAQFEGKLSADGNAIEGSWIQGGSLPLVLKRGGAPKTAPPKRPQNPTKPYPYREEEVTYSNSAAGIRFSATLTIPEGKGPFPAVLLITGSGPQDRDETIGTHKPFLVLADHLTRHGIAVLRADDRGTGKSGGKFVGATSADFAGDAEAGVAYLKSRPELNPRKIGLVGHSEGGLIAPLVASRNPDVAFIVMMAGPGVRGDALLYEQNRQLMEAGGGGPEAARKAAENVRVLMELVEAEKDVAALKEKAQAKLPDVPAERLALQISMLEDPWMRYFLTYDPVPILRKVTCPVLALNGSLDRQVWSKQNLPPIRKALEESGNAHFEVVEMAGLNHLFQTAKTGGVQEYETLEETMAPAVLEKIAGWIGKQ
jgi:pimeloyl-ACP methyl ester carboxylesterase